MTKDSGEPVTAGKYPNFEGDSSLTQPERAAICLLIPVPIV